MKVCVIGTGAMGSIYGSFFAKNNFDVLCYDVWDEHVDAINNKGLRVSGISGDHTEKKIRATTNFNELKDRDLYIIATKGDAVGSVASKLANFDLSSAIVLTIQNGLGAAERIEKFMPTENVLLGVAQGFGASIKAPGHAHHNGMSMIRIGEINGGLTDRLTTIVNAWEEAGFTSKGFEDIQQLIWEKFICNVAYSGPCSVFKKTIGEILNDKNADAEIKEIATNEFNSLKETISNLEREIQFSLLPKDKDDVRNVILEVRAGTGGDEAGLFASNLFSMYEKLSIKNKWKFEV